MTDPTSGLPCALGGPLGEASMRCAPEDFQVEELLGYGPSGSGEHAFLRLRKRGLDTLELARRIARLAGVPRVAVGFAGLKDRHALTTQAFSVQLPGRGDPDWSRLEEGSVEVLEVARHGRKIRRGSLRGNRFRLVLREVRADPAALEARLRQIAGRGVPNYFGPQRFGRGGGNLVRAGELFAGRRRRMGREQRGLLLSAVRAQLFNEVLAERVARGDWERALPGDVMLVAGSGGQFLAEAEDPTLAARTAALEIHPSGPLYGAPGRALRPAGAVAALEAGVLARHPLWVGGLEAQRLEAGRRALRLPVADLGWSLEAGLLVLDFSLEAGGYATTLVRELLAPRACAGSPPGAVSA